MSSMHDARTDDQLKEALVECGRICYDHGLMTANNGNISARMLDGHILITPKGICKGRIKAAELVTLDINGHGIGAVVGAGPSSETPMHLEVYRQRHDVMAVIHAHPPFATALTVAGLPFPTNMLPEALVLLGDVPTTTYATPSSADDADAIRPFISAHDALLLPQHGALTVGADLEEALNRLECLEHVAEVFWRANALGHVERLSPDERWELQQRRPPGVGSE